MTIAPTRPYRVALLAPMPSELKPLVRVFGLHRTILGDVVVHSGALGDVEIVATTTGMGTASAARATERLLGSTTVDHVMVVGIAGGIDPNVGIGDVIAPHVVVDASTGAEYRPAPLGDVVSEGVLFTSDEFTADPDVVARLVDRGVTAVDMETASIAAVCEAAGCPWSVFRGISDRPADDLVDETIFGLAHPDGSANLRAVARFLLPRPWRVRRLARIARDMKVAAMAAAQAAARACAQAPPLRRG